MQECYDTTCDSYDEQYAEEQNGKYKAAQKALNNPPSCGVVLDVGCGSGLFFPETAGKAQTLVGVDVSCSLLCKAKVQAKKYLNVHVVQADADHLPFKTQSFDQVFCFTVLQNMPQPKETLIEFKRQTRIGGKIVVTGLKKAFELNKFLDLFEEAELRLLEFVDDADLKCYIAVTAPS